MRDVNYEKLTKRAISIYSQERAALIAGNATALQLCAAQKAELLAEITTIEAQLTALPNSPASEQRRGRLDSLHTIIQRRNRENGTLARSNNTDDAPAGRSGSPRAACGGR